MMNRASGFFGDPPAGAATSPGGAVFSIQFNQFGFFGGFGSFSGTTMDISGIDLVGANAYLNDIFAATVNAPNFFADTIDVNDAPYIDAGNYTGIFVTTTTDHISVQLLDASLFPNLIRVIKKVDNRIGTVDITDAGGNQIENSTTYQLRLENESVILQSDGVHWWIIGSNNEDLVYKVSPAGGSTVNAISGKNVLLRIGSGALATLTIKFPTNPKNGDLFTINFRTAVGVLTLSSTSTIDLPPAAAVALTSYTWKYYNIDDEWFRIS